METRMADLVQFQSKDNIIQKTPLKIDLAELFKGRECPYLNEFLLYVAYFGTIPNFVKEMNIDCKKASQWLLNSCKAEIRDVYFDKRPFDRWDNAQLDDIFFILYEDLMVFFNTRNSSVWFMFRITDLLKTEAIIDQVKRFKEKKARRKPKFYVIVNIKHEINSEPLDISSSTIKLDENYNDDFKEIHGTILKRLSKKNDKGLVLLHGKPGTGKTSYIRHLISRLKKHIIFLPPNMAGIITGPALISILIDNPNSILVIEDAENIVVDRETSGCSPVSALLNISDGLLSDCLNIQVICSFNTDISKVDNALLRKGRLIAKYEFRELDIRKAQQLSDKLGYKTTIYRPMTLSEIYNQGEMNFQQTNMRPMIGFKAGQIR